MTSENAIIWLSAQKFTRWRLYRGETEKEKVDEFDEGETDVTPEEAAERLAGTLSLLASGLYVLKGWRGKGRQAAQSVFRFNANTTTNRAMNHGQSMDIQEIIRKAEENAYIKLELANWRKEVDKRLDNIETLLKKLTDDDEDNDEDAIEKFTERVPQIANAFSSVKSLLKTTN